MSSRYRLPRGPRKSPPGWVIRKRDGKFLASETVPFEWSERNPLVFRSRQSAERAARRWFIGPNTMRQFGIRAEKL